MSRTAAALMICFLSPALLAADYYVSPLGNDANVGTSPVTAFRTVGKANSIVLGAGDRVLFEGGATFPGMIYIGPHETGTPADPIVITSYGSGKATIDGGADCAFLAYNTEGFEIREIDFIGSGMIDNSGSGILLLAASTDGRKYEHVRIDQVAVSGFRLGGITILSSDPSEPGFRDLEITNSVVFGNGQHGIASAGFDLVSSGVFAHENFHVAHNEAHGNLGDPGEPFGPTGSGIVLSGVDGALVEFNRAHDNGGINSQNSGGPAGIWAWHANAVIVQHNISHDNRTGGNYDGSGFILDGGVTDSILQYNLSYNNAGAGYSVNQFDGAAPCHNNVVRYNVGYNDGRENGSPGFDMWVDAGESLSDVDIYGNTIHVSPSPTGTPSAFRIQSTGLSGIQVSNNIFVTEGGLRLVHAFFPVGTSAVFFQGNAYWSDGQPFVVKWGGASYGSLGSWRAGTGQEKLGASPVGRNTDPLLLDTENPELLTDPTELAALSAFRLQDGSPLVEAGLSLPVLFGIDAGPHDFYGQTVTEGPSFDIGAEEHKSCAGSIDGDGDGLPDCADRCPTNGNKTDPEVCGCGFAETDADGDGTPDCVDVCPSDPTKIDPGICGCGELESTCPVQNMLVNPGFEQGSLGWENWGGGVLSPQAHSGASSLRLGPDQSGWAQAVPGLSPCRTYVLRAWTRVGLPSAGGWVGIDFYDAVDVLLGKAAFNVEWTDWQQGSVTFSSPPGTAEAFVWSWNGSAPVDLWVDDFVLVEVTGCPDNDCDGTNDCVDTCPDHANPGQGPVTFGQSILASGKTVFSWPVPVEALYVTGDLGQVEVYATSGPAIPISGASSFHHTATPSPGEGIYYLVRPDCPAGSWQTGFAAGEPGRDQMLP